MAFLVENLDEIGAYLGKCDSCDAFDEQYYTAASLALHFHKVSRCAIEDATVNAHVCAFFDVYLLGAQVDDLLVARIGDGDELLHLAVGDCDWNVFATNGACAVLQKINPLLEIFYNLLCGVDEDEVVHGRCHLSAFCAVASCDKCLFHWNETFDSFFVEKIFCNEFPAVGSAHSKPGYDVVLLHCVSVWYFVFCG